MDARLERHIKRANAVRGEKQNAVVVLQQTQKDFDDIRQSWREDRKNEWAYQRPTRFAANYWCFAAPTTRPLRQLVL